MEEERTQVRLVDVFNPICHDGIGYDQVVQLYYELSFLWGIIFCIPVPKGSPLAFCVHLEQTNKSR